MTQRFSFLTGACLLALLSFGCATQPSSAVPEQSINAAEGQMTDKATRAVIVPIARRAEVLMAAQSLETASVRVPQLVQRESVTLASPEPSFWPKTITWRPRRHFGMFREGSDLSQIQVLINGASASWYFNDFFADQDQTAKDIYRIYYRPSYSGSTAGVTLPTDNTPALSHRPGDLLGIMNRSASQAPNAVTTSADGAANNILLSAYRSYYSNKFGGSLAIHFRAADIDAPSEQTLVSEDFEYEFTKGDYRFDLDNLEMILYVNPRTTSFNPKITAVNMNTVGGVEFLYSDYVGYTDVHPVTSPEAETTLHEAMHHVGSSVISSLVGGGPTSTFGVRPPASVFAHAWIHNQFTDLIADNDKVVKILIKNNWADVATEQYEPYFFARWKIDYIVENLPFSIFNEISMEYDVNIRVYHVPMNSADEYLMYSVSYEDFEEFEESHWIPLYGGTIEECSLINNIRVEVRLRELDQLLNPDDHYEPAMIRLQLVCDAIQSQANQTVYVGIVRNAIIDGSDSGFTSDGETWGTHVAVRQGESDGAEINWDARVDMTAR